MFEDSNGYPCRRFKSIDEFDIIQETGSGGYSIVYLVRHKKSKKKYALKCAFKEKSGKDRSQRTRTEIEVLEYLDHPNIINLVGWFEDEKNIYLVLKYVRGKDLDHFFKNDLPKHRDAVKIIKQLIESVIYCHSMGVIHRDIKFNNVLIDKSLRIQLCDFGLCCVRKRYNDIFKSQVGTVRYNPPEMLKGKGYDERADIWCIGIVLFRLITGEYPFDGSNKKEIISRIKNRSINYSKHMFDPESLDLLEKILVKDPKHRISLEDILDHSWLH